MISCDEASRMARRTNRLVCEKAALRKALKSTRAALRLLQPALNVMARECLDDIIEREIDAAIGKETKQ